LRPQLMPSDNEGVWFKKPTEGGATPSE
jgi:hypothetical protein